MVKKFILLLLISVCLGDTLILKDKTVHNGTLINFVDDEIMFEASLSTNPLRSKILTVIIDDIEELELLNGIMVIENGIIVATNEEHIKSTSYDRYVNINKDFITRDTKSRLESQKQKELKKGKSANIIYIGCGIISVAAIGVLFIWSQSTILLW